MKGKKRKELLAAILSLVLVVSMIAGDFSTMKIANAAATSTTAGTSTAKWVDGAYGETAQIDFSFATQDIIENETADIVLVLDTSGSMDQSQKLEKAKEAAQAFVTNLLGSDTYKNYVRIAVVGYDDQAYDYYTTTTYQWWDVFHLNPETAYHYPGLTNNAEELGIMINKLNADGATFTQDGIKKAETILAGSTADNKIIILLSDGEATYSYKVNSVAAAATQLNVGNVKLYTSFDYNTIMGDGSNDAYEVGHWRWGRWIVDATYSNGLAAISEAKFAKDAGIELYTIGYKITANSHEEKVMKDIASGSANYQAANVSASNSNSPAASVLTALNNIKDTVIQTVTAGKNVSFTATLESYLSVASASDITVMIDGSPATIGAVNLSKNSTTNEYTVTYTAPQFLAGNHTYKISVTATSSKTAADWNTCGNIAAASKAASLAYSKNDGSAASPILFQDTALMVNTYKITSTYVYTSSTGSTSESKDGYVIAGQSFSYSDSDEYLAHTEKYDRSSENLYTNGETVAISADTVITTNYSLKKFVIRFENTDSTKIEESNADFGSNFTLPDGTGMAGMNVPAGKKFSAWTDGTNTYAAGTVLTDVQKSYTYQPVFENVAYAVSYNWGIDTSSYVIGNVVSGVSGSVFVPAALPATQSPVYYGDNVTVDSLSGVYAYTVTTVSGSAIYTQAKTFKGWNTASIEGTVYTNGQTFALPVGGMTVTGTWDSNYQVVYDFGTLPVEYQAEYTLPGAASYVVGDIFVIADNLSATADSHYSFAGWNVSNPEPAEGETVIITAAWTENYLVTFDLNTAAMMIPAGSSAAITLSDGTVITEVKSFYSIEDVTTSSIVVKSKVAAFGGWTYSKEGNVITFTANWTPKVNYYVLLPGQPIPSDEIKGQPVAHYTYGLSGTIKLYSQLKEAADATVIDTDYVGTVNGSTTGTTGFKLKNSTEYLTLDGDEFVDWYVVKWDANDGWHVDGIVANQTGSYTVRYVDDVTGEDIIDSVKKDVEDQFSITESYVDLSSKYYSLVGDETQTLTSAQVMEVYSNGEVVITFRYSKVMTAYTVNHYYTGDTTPFLSEGPTSIWMGLGTVTGYAQTVAGFYADATSKTIELNYEANVIDFYYTRIPESLFTVSYVVVNNTGDAISYTTPSTSTYVEGTTVYVSGDISVDTTMYEFSGWSSSDTAATGGSFVMPGKSVVFTGTITKIEVPEVTPTPEVTPEATPTPEPTVEIDTDTTNPGNPVEVTVTPTPEQVVDIETDDTAESAADVLPQTGTTSNTLIYLLGAALVIGGCTVLRKSKKTVK